MKFIGIFLALAPELYAQKPQKPIQVIATKITLSAFFDDVEALGTLKAKKTDSPNATATQLARETE